jgi:opacity protein-like surface antigen
VKRLAVFLAASALVVSVSAANAASNWIGLAGGAGIPTGDYHNAAATGWHLAASGVHMIDTQWGVGADLGYHAWGGSTQANAAAQTAFGPGSEFNWSAFQLTAQGLMAFPTQGAMKPYVTAGLGLYDVSAKLKSPSGNADTSKNEFGFNFGAGMDLGSSKNMKWGVQGAYHIIPASNDLGTDLNFFSIGANLMWGAGK